MKLLLAGLVAAGVTLGFAPTVLADTTVIHKESEDGDHSKTVVKHDDGSKTVVKRHGDEMKKVHTDANGDKTVVKKTPD